jgi:hypothetical protein
VLLVETVLLVLVLLVIVPQILVMVVFHPMETVEAD